MEARVTGKAEARRLELDGYNRTGSKTVIVPFEQLQDLLEREDVTVSKITLHRQAGGEEADVIDHYVRNQVADKGTVYRTTFTHNRSGEIKAKTGSVSNKVLEASENEVTVHSHFERALIERDIDDDFYDMESFERVREKALNTIGSEIDSLQSKLETLEARRERYQDITPDEVEH